MYRDTYFVIADPKVIKVNSPTVMYSDPYTAMTEAERLCRKEKGRFYVVKVVSYCELNNVTWRHMEDKK
jgi:hypothetical protein